MPMPGHSLRQLYQIAEVEGSGVGIFKNPPDDYNVPELGTIV